MEDVIAKYFIKSSKAIKDIVDTDADFGETNNFTEDEAKEKKLFQDLSGEMPNSECDIVTYLLLVKKLRLYQRVADQCDIDYPTWAAKFDTYMQNHLEEITK